MAKKVTGNISELNIPPMNEKQAMCILSLANEQLYGGALGAGKAVELNTQVLTTDGWKTMGTVQVGDYVFDEKGQPTRVVAKSDIIRERTFRIEFDKREYIIAGENHDWVTLTYNERQRNHRRTPEYRERRRKQRAAKRAKGLSEKEKKTDRVRADLAERNSTTEYDVLDMIKPSKRSTLEFI
jgi:hypothetical protein